MKHTIKDQSDIDYCIEHLKSLKLQTKAGKAVQYSYEAKKIVGKKSYSQIKLYFAWIRFILIECGYSVGDANKYSESFHCDLKKRICGKRVEVSVGDLVIEKVPSIKGFDKNQMTRYLNMCKEYLEPEFGLTLPLPEDRFVEQFMAKYGDGV